jgi:hypothetical protein
VSLACVTSLTIDCRGLQYPACGVIVDMKRLQFAACRNAYSLLAEVEAIRRIHARQIEVRTLTYSYKLIDSSSIVRQHRRRVSHLA